MRFGNSLPPCLNAPANWIKGWIWVQRLEDRQRELLRLEALYHGPIHPSFDIHDWSPVLSRNVSTFLLSIRKNTNVPNRPRWLVEKGHMDRAQASLAYLRDADPTSDEVAIELESIQANVAAHKAAPESSWTALFTHKPLFRRLWRAALLQFMAQMCGNTAMKYYLPSIFASLGIEHRITLLISGIESTLKIGCTIIEMMIIDRVGRRTTLVVGCVVMAIALLVSFPLQCLTCTEGCRSMVLCRSHTRRTSIMQRITPALSSFSSIHSDTPSDSGQLLGCMVLRSAPSLPAWSPY